ncbi:MAG: conjugal transfer protein TraG N-terminal domain-containing protein [Rhodospirillales bacterium]|nr:conjugal transfer protein TraG N-terminal domain-containing protein [Rhodospirillales bacterium]
MYELFTLGGGPYLVDLLNAVAAITSGGAYVTLAQLAGACGVAWIVFRTAFGGSWRDNAKWILLFVTVWGAMIVPKATVRVVDRLDPALAPAVVANVPIGLALFASITSQVGDGLTRLTEQAFTLPNDLAYRRHGLIFGARLAATATRLEVTDAVFARNLRNFTRQCVFHALLLGHISADDLRESTDVWALVTAGGSPSAGASPARMFEFATRLPAAATGATPVDREIVTCRDGAARLNAAWTAEINRAGTLFGRRIFPDARTQALARAELLAALPAAHDFLIGASRSAAGILRQQMVLNAVHDAGEQWAAEAGNAAALQTYTEARAEAQTAAAYRAIGRQAETWVPLLRIVFECLYVGAFPLAVLLMLTPAGVTIFRSYVTGLIWLQSWGPLYAILHRISMGEAAERMQAAALMPGGDVGISLVAQAGIRAVAADVAVMSGYLSMSIPFLAAALAYGLSKATVLATSVLAVGQDAATSAAHEGTTGNLSLANTQWDTHRFASQEGRQLRTSAHVDTDRYTGYTGPGGLFTMAPDGTVVADMGSATSRVPAAGVRLSESLAVSHEERAAEARSMGRNWDVQAASARSAAATDATQMVERYAHDVSTGTAHTRGVTESESAEVRALESHVEKLAESSGLTKDQTMMLTGEASLGGGLGRLLGASGSATWRGQTIEADAWDRMQEYDRQHGVTDLWSRVQEASRRYSTSTGDSELSSLEESLGANLTRMQRFEDRAALSYGESEQWSEQAAAVRSDARSIERELGQPFFVWLSGREGTGGRPIGAGGAMRLASPQTPEDAEAPREHAAAFIAERFPAPAGPGPAAVTGREGFEAAREDFEQAHGPAAGTAHADWAAGVRERAAGAGAPGPGDAGEGAEAGRGEVEAELAARETGRDASAQATGEATARGRAGVAAEHDRPFRDHAAEGVPFVGGWLAGKLYGTARNSMPTASDPPASGGLAERQAEEDPAARRSGPDWGGP